MLTRPRLRSANILLVGMKTIANEIAKNLVLAGIGSLTILDDQLVTEDDLGSQFFISDLHIGLNVCIPPGPILHFPWLICPNSERLLQSRKSAH